MVQNAGLGVGALLRQRREELGQDIEAVSRQLRIRAIYIRAIEEGRLQDLPGTAYAVGFVRTYADFLGFEGNSVVADYRDELGQRSRTEPVSWRMEERESHFPGGKLLIVCLILAGIGYGGWYYLSNTPTGAGLIEAVPDYLKKSGGEPETTPPAEAPKAAETTTGEGTAGEGATGTSTETAPATTDGSTAATGTSTPDTSAAGEETTNSDTGSSTGGDAAQTGGTEGNATAPSAEATGAAPAGATANSAEPAASGEANQTAAAPAESGTASPDVAAAAASTATRVNIHAKLESWVQIVDKDGKPILSRVLRAGETYSVPDQAGLVMSTGNAGGIEMLLDGKPLQNLGAVGLVRRNIPLDPEKLSSGASFMKTPTSGGSDNSGD